VVLLLLISLIFFYLLSILHSFFKTFRMKSICLLVSWAWLFVIVERCNSFVPLPTISRATYTVAFQRTSLPKRQASTLPTTNSESNPSKPKKKNKKKLTKRKRTSNSSKTNISNPSAKETWRLYGVNVHPDDLVGEEHQQFPKALQEVLKKRFFKGEELSSTSVTVVRRSLDARKKLHHPTFQYVVDVTVTAVQAQTFGFRIQSGKLERLETVVAVGVATQTHSADEDTAAVEDTADAASSDPKPSVVIVGAGPAGLFCALQLALNGVKPILLDRGQPVEKRGRDIGALMHRRQLNPESNFAFGEGGAGTWSDGKLTTRIGRNSDNVRWILETLVEYGAPSKILWEGSPHLGTDNLVRLLRNMRQHLRELGGEIHFGAKMTDLEIDNGVVQGVHVEHADGSTETLRADATVMATGHSARDVYESLHKAGVTLEPKGFAVGFRIEHPQKLINQIQYGDEWGPCVQTGKRPTDVSNREYFGTAEPEHPGKLPVPSYRLATDQAKDGTGKLRGVYSFCMCPGGQIVPSSTDPTEVCVNGMSFSKRDSMWANSALVVTVFPDDEILEPYQKQHGVMGGLEFQRDMERRAAELGGGNWTVPVQRVTDFCQGVVSETIPSSSYRLGVESAACHEIYPPQITNALRDALQTHFGNRMPGYLHPDGLLHAVETRTSSPLRIARDLETCQAMGIENLFPAGEGAGFAGGIVSAAVDGRIVAESVLDQLVGTERAGRVEKTKSVGFSY
jgi:uncharacterized FAD-dependent dehydrogenase